MLTYITVVEPDVDDFSIDVWVVVVVDVVLLVALDFDADEWNSSILGFTPGGKDWDLSFDEESEKIVLSYTVVFCFTFKEYLWNRPAIFSVLLR